MLFDAVDTLLLVLPAVAGALAECKFRPERMRAALSSTMMATDLADYLVRKGATFREAHGAVGRLVRESEEERLELHTLPLSAFTAAHALFGRMCSTRCRRTNRSSTARWRAVPAPAPYARSWRPHRERSNSSREL